MTSLLSQKRCFIRTSGFRISFSSTNTWALSPPCTAQVFIESLSFQQFNQPANKNELNIYSFLKLHDKRHKKLWFLWNSGYEALRCGCIGGTAFFGNNINGPKFFKPSAQDIQDGINIARYQYAFNYDDGMISIPSVPNWFHNILISISTVSTQIRKNMVLEKVYSSRIN